MRLKNQQINRKCYDKNKSIVYTYNKKLVILQGYILHITIFAG